VEKGAKLDTLFKVIAKCRICAQTSFADVISLGFHPLSGCFPHTNEPDPPSAPLQLVRCTSCGLLQLAHSVDPQRLYTSGYGYRSGINSTMRNHLAGIADGNIKRFAPAAGSVILDIGCNDGTLLMQYPSHYVRIGIDPLAEKFIYPQDITVTNAYFSAAPFNALTRSRKASIITSIAMFYDLEEPNKFVADIAACLDPEGVWVLEQSYMPGMLKRNSYDTICHEHLEYYGLRQIERLTETNGLRVFDVGLTEINGASFRLYVCHANASHAESPSLANLREAEAKSGLNAQGPYDAFRDRCIQLRDDLRKLIETEVAAGRRIHAYGASTKGNTILQYCGLDHSLIEAVADRNPEKTGARTPVTNIPIISEEKSRAMGPDYFLALPWHFKTEFLARETDFRRRGGKFIFPLPEIIIC
jgi:NDP-4-keto-2,6-dideoxyhexose 3-C-methyltransferase